MFIFILLVLFTVSSAYECYEDNKKPFYSDHERGWFYKEVCEEKKEEKKEKKEVFEYRILEDTQVKIPWDKLDKLDPDDIQKIYQKAKKTAVMFPTEHNVKEYQKLVIWIQKKSEAFMETAARVIRQDRYLASVASEVPVSSIERQTFYEEENRFRDDVLSEFKDKAGLVVVVQEGCSYCEKQKRILKWFSEETGWSYKLVEKGNVPNMVRKLGIARVPDIFLVINNNGKAIWMRIGTGLHTQLELERAIIFGLYNAGLIKPERKGLVLY